MLKISFRRSLQAAFASAAMVALVAPLTLQAVTPVGEETPIDPTERLVNRGVLEDKSLAKIEEMVVEFEEKMGYPFYVITYDRLGVDESSGSYRARLEQSLSEPYIFFLFVGDSDNRMLSLRGQPEGIITAEQVNEVINEFVVPILSRQRHGDDSEVRFNAAIFNGVSRAMGLLAEAGEVTLESVPEYDNELQQSMFTIIVRSLLFLTIVGFVVLFYLRSRSGA